MLHQANYLINILKNNEIPLLEQVQFAALAIDPLSKIHDELFNALAPYTQKIDQLPAEAQAFFISILPKISLKDIAELFDTNFSDENKLKKMGCG